MLDENSLLGQYISPAQKSLIKEGYYLLSDAKAHTPVDQITDYSYLVFPFAKAYEGFLKQLFLDQNMISRTHYDSDHFRIGKVLSPNMADRLGRNSVYFKLKQKFGNALLADKLWQTWKHGRNLIFHYFPHNYKSISLEEAEQLITTIVQVMDEAVGKCQETASWQKSKSRIEKRPAFY